MKKVIYTVLFGDYELYEPEYENPDWDFICFSDKPIESKNWTVINLNRNVDKKKASRMLKIRFHRYLDCDLCIYIDAKFKIKCDLDKFVNENLSTDIAVMKHNRRNCAYDEIKFCSKIGNVSKRRLMSQLNDYKENGFPRNFGLWAPDIMIRRNTPEIRAFMDAWFLEIVKYTYRDIPGFSYTLWKNNIMMDEMPFKKTYRLFK